MHDALLLSAHALSIVNRSNGQSFLAELAPSAIFPDGSLLFTQPGDCDFIRFELLAAGSARGLAMSRGSSFPLFRPTFSYVLLYPQSYAAKLGELQFVAGSTALPLTESDLHNPVDVLIEWKARSHTNSQLARYVQHLKMWSESVFEGVCGERPAYICSSYLSYSEQYAWFQLDVSTSGPLTLIWLILSHLNYGIDVRPIRSLYFNTRSEFDPRLIYDLRGEQLQL